MAANRFQVRNRFHEVEGTYTKQEILQRIAAGKFSGEEEISAGGSDAWQKIASHPAFYDAFLKKLFAGEYKAPEGEESSISRVAAKTRGEKGTRQGEVRGTATQRPPDPEPTEDLGKTRRLLDVKDGGATLQQADIEDLFRDGSGEAAGMVPFGGPAGKTEANPLQAPLAEPTEVLPAPIGPSPTGGRLDIAGVAAEPDALAVAAKKKAVGKKTRLALAAAVAVLLCVLFQMGGEEKKPEPVKEKPFASRQWMNDTSTRDELLQTLVEEADSLALSDTPLFYQGAVDVLKESFTYDESSPISHGKAAQYDAYLINYVTDKEKLFNEINQLIASGRAADPHFSQFYRAEALVLIHEKKFEEARAAALHAAETDPTNADNYLLVGELHAAVGDLSQAVYTFSQAVKGLPNNVRAHYMLAKALYDSNDYARAETEALEALRLNPLHPPSYLMLGQLALAANRLNDARGLFETCGKLARFTSRDVAGMAHYELGRIYEASGNLAAARDSYRLAWYYLPTHSADLKAKVEKLNLAPASLKKLAEDNEYEASYFLEQGDGDLAQAKLAEAIRFFQAARLLDPRSSAPLIRLGDVTEKTAGSYGDFRRVMLLYQRAIEKEPAEAMGYIKLGTLETEQYNFDRGFKLLTQAVTLSPQTADPYVALGKHYYKRQDYNEALNQFLKAAKINPNDSEVLYYAGMLRLLFKREGMKDALRFFYQSYTLNPQNYDALVEWLKLKVQNYEKNFAIKFVRNLIEAEPKNPNLQWVMGEVYAAAKEYRRAIVYYHSALDLDNRASKVRMSLARALESVGELDKAVAEYRLASLLDRRNSDGFYHAADLLFQTKAYNQAEEVLKFLISVTPNYPGAQRYLSKIYEVRKNKDQAIAAMQKEVAANPENYKYVLELAELYMGYEKYDQAVTELTKVSNLPSLAKAPEYVYDKIRGYLLLSRCYRAQNKLESAEGAIRLALEIDANDPELHRELGYVYYAQQRDKEGVKAFQFYLSKNPAARDSETIKGLIQKMQIEE